MREFCITVPYSELEKFGAREVMEEFRACGAETMSTLVCKGKRGIGLVDTESPLDTATVLDYEGVHRLEPVGERNGRYEYLYELEATELGWLLDEYALEIFVESDLVLTERGIEATLVGTQEAISQTATDLDDASGVDDVDCEVTHIREYDGQTGLLEPLTDRQREVLEEAHSMGYYDIPRHVSSDELADSLDLEKSTVLEHLRRAECNLLNQIFGEPERLVYQ